MTVIGAHFRIIAIVSQCRPGASEPSPVAPKSSPPARSEKPAGLWDDTIETHLFTGGIYKTSKVLWVPSNAHEYGVILPTYPGPILP